MVFFGAIVAPLVFLKLQEPIAGDFIRAIFPWYYGYLEATGLLTTLGLILEKRRGAAILMGTIVLSVFFLALVWMPHLETLRLAGDTAAFDTGHSISVWINGAQLLLVLALLVRTAIRK
jgi:hypothetical protein